MQYLQSRKISDFFENFLLTFMFNSWYNASVDKREANRTPGKPDEEPDSTLKSEYPPAPAINRGSTRRHERVKVDNRRGRWEIKEKERNMKQ